jgi:hypothetical protein
MYCTKNWHFASNFLPLWTESHFSKNRPTHFVKIRRVETCRSLLNELLTGIRAVLYCDKVDIGNQQVTGVIATIQN